MQYKAGLTSAILLAATVQAQSSTSSSNPSECSFAAETTASSQADLDKYSNCKKITGDLVITGDLGTAALAGVQEIDGSLLIRNATKLSSFSADSLNSITKSLEMKGLTILESASFGSLEKVPIIYLQTLPQVSEIKTKLKRAKEVTISDTNLETLDGFDSLETIERLDINNNRGLASINSKLTQVSNSLQIGFNGQQSEVVFDNLAWANNITLRDISSVSFKSLETVNSTLAFISTSLDEIEMGNLTKVGNTVTIEENEHLADVSFPKLTTVGGAVVVANNTNLKKIGGFSNLQSIGNALIAIGDFGYFDLSNLKNIKGGARIATSASNFSCDPFKKLQGSGNIQGKLECTSGHSSASDDGKGSPHTASKGGKSDGSKGGDSSESHSNAAVGFGPTSSFMGAVAAVALALL